MSEAEPCFWHSVGENSVASRNRSEKKRKRRKKIRTFSSAEFESNFAAKIRENNWREIFYSHRARRTAYEKEQSSWNYCSFFFFPSANTYRHLVTGNRKSRIASRAIFFEFNTFGWTKRYCERHADERALHSLLNRSTGRTKNAYLLLPIVCKLTARLCARAGRESVLSVEFLRTRNCVLWKYSSLDERLTWNLQALFLRVLE